jgi:hypothetical protein
VINSTNTITKEKQQPLRKISHTFVSSRNACTLIIGKEIATKHGLLEPSDVLVEDTPRGILIRKINVDELA